MTELTGKVGFASPVSERKLLRRRFLGVELIAAVALTVCLIIAVAAVSIGMARAQALATIDQHDHTPFAVALFFGALMAGMGGLTAIVAGDRQTPRD
jgi:prepilin signal peptidase PulO-like enzyme (type II secretory pathway)